MRTQSLALLALIYLLTGRIFAADDASTAPASERESRAAVEAATKAVEADPKNLDARKRRAELFVRLRQHEKAVADFNELLKLDPRPAAAWYDARGSELLLLGKFKEAIADFDRFIAARPDQEPWHWKRGIAYYYAGLFKEGKQQFEGYQTVDDNDVENAVWRYLCMARDQGEEAARKSLLKIKDDTRVPMMQVYELFAGRLEPADVLKAANSGDPSPAELNNRLFYAHLYLGLYHEATGQAELARRHLSQAADKHLIGHYMWDIARMHADRPAPKTRR